MSAIARSRTTDNLLGKIDIRAKFLKLNHRNVYTWFYFYFQI